MNKKQKLAEIEQSLNELEQVGIIQRVMRPDGQIGFGLTPYGELIANLTALDSDSEVTAAGS